ncbi:MAG: tRNA pseudouridine(38-40) synthase TruA [Desulfuromonas sp.]|nr:tRNA pseudouridine(38-40) synthase TruA [Desulfuromonas sp.]
MPRLCMTLEYDGSNYGGWQVQPNAVTIQQRVEEALQKVAGVPIRLYSSGRTDAGVHAQGMCAHFDIDDLLPLAAYLHGVNRYLPTDIAVRDVRRVSDAFHARFGAQGKWYRYTIYRHPVRSPLHERTSWQISAELDVPRMVDAAALLVGRHDFAALRSSSCVAQTTVREIFDLTLTEQGDELQIDVRGSGFLKNMVRVLVGTLVEVGRGKKEPDWVAELLRGGERIEAGRTAPAKGLCLMKVWY